VTVREDGEWLVPVLRGISFATEAEAEAFVVADNRAAELGGWRADGLAAMLTDLASSSLGLRGVGYDAGSIEDLLATDTFRTEKMAIADLKPHPLNYRVHPPDQLAHIAASIKAHGFYRNIVVARDGTVLAGHGVVEAAQSIGRKRVPVIRLNLDPGEPRALKVLTSDNEISKAAESDDRALTELLKSLVGVEGPEGLLGTGYNSEQLAGLVMVTRPASEIGTEEDAAAWVGMPDYDPGSVQIKMVITFPSVEKRKEFADALNLRVDKFSEKGSTWSTRWPWAEREDCAGISFQPAGAPAPATEEG
jgi:hypothetical protein